MNKVDPGTQTPHPPSSRLNYKMSFSDDSLINTGRIKACPRSLFDESVSSTVNSQESID